MDIFWENKKILITGGNGFLGKHLVNRLKEKGVREENIFAPTFDEYDFKKMEDCQKAISKKQIVIHLAGIVGGLEFNQSHSGQIFYDNGAMALNILEVCRLEKIEKFVGIGSVCEYPKLAPIPFREEDLWDGYPDPINAPYGLAKKMMLVGSQAYRTEYGLNAIHLLMTNFYGPGDNFDPKTSHVIPALIKKVADAKKEGRGYIEVWGTGKATRSFLYVKDAVEAIILATEKYNKPEPINVGPNIEISIKELVEMICKLMSFTGQIHWDTSKPDGQPRRALDTSKAEKEFGFVAKASFEEGLKEEVNYYNT